jgi:CRISPR type III-A-associated protein Csm2
MKGQEEPIKTIVTKDDPDLLVKEARELAGRLRRDEATRTQVRRLFGTMRKIEMSWPREVKEDDPQAQQVRRERDDAYRELVLFGPRLVYQNKRQEGRLTPLVKAIQEGIKSVAEDKEDRRRLQRLVQFFEATVAYYVAGPQKGGA